MDIETSKAIKLFFPNPSLLLVYFEALANALDAEATEISIAIDIESFDKPETLKITITDNGCGFTEENFDRFKTLLKTRDLFHKGIGRLVFLNYFNQIEINSIWDNKQRNFVFKEGFDGKAPVVELPEEHANSTSLVFTDFAKDRIKSYDDLKPESLKALIVQHFLPTLHELVRNERNFRINVALSTTSENPQKEFFSNSTVIIPTDLPQMIEASIKDSSIDAFEHINMLYHVADTGGRGSQLIAFNIDGRTIPADIIQQSSIPVGYSVVFLFESKLFHTNSDSSRQKLILPEGMHEANLFRVLRLVIGQVLSQYIPKIVESNTKTKKQFEDDFPHLLGYFEESVVGLIDKDEALNNAQAKFFMAQKEILQCEKLDESTYEKSIELSSRTLTEYILYRDKIIRRMREMTEDNSEAEIHNLIVPRYQEYQQDSIVSDVYKNNAWLLDDKFMGFQTILSDSKMDKVIAAIRLDEESTGEDGRPDIAMIFSGDPDSEQSVDVVVVEIKKKTDDEKENQYAINQLLDRAVKLAAYCPNVQRIWYYAVIQISDTMATRLRQQRWAPLFSMGKVFYQEFLTERPDGTPVPTPTFAMSFDAIVADAHARNHTFLEILRSGMKKHAEMQGAGSTNGSPKE